MDEKPVPTTEDVPDEETSLKEHEADVGAPTTDLMRKTLFRGGVLSAFGYRDYRLLWSGAFLSNIGTWIHMTALLWFVKELTDSNAWVGAVNLATFAPVILFVIYAGSLADRVDRRKLIMVTQVVMMLGALGLGLAVTFGVDSLALIMCLTVVTGVAFVFNFPAWRAMVPDLVPPSEILNGVALDAAQFNMARFVGPAIGALILTSWTVEGAFYVNAASYLAVIAALALIRARPIIHPSSTGGAGEHMIEGFRYLKANPWATKLLVVLAVPAFFGISAIVLLPAMSRDILDKGASGYGWLMGTIGLGAVVGAPLVTLLSRRFPERDIIKATMLAFSAILMVLALSHNYALSLCMTFSIGVVFLMASASINTVLQSRVERNMRGRIMSFYILVFQGTAPIGGLLLGLLSDRTSTPSAVAIGAAVCFAFAVVIIVFPSILREAVSPQREVAGGTPAVR